MRLKLAADYGAWPPLWFVDSERGAPEEVIEGIDEELRNEVREWCDRVDELKQTGYEWPSEEEFRHWDARGRDLARRLDAALGDDIEILYWVGEGDFRHLAPASELPA